MKRGLLSRSASCCYALCVLWLGLMGRADAQVTADFTSNTQSGCSPLTVQFIPQTTGAISSYQWDFGNGNTSTLPSPAVIYLNPGMYTVTLIVSDGVVQDTMIKTNYIKIFADPVADYEADVTAGCVPLSVQLTDSSIGLDAPIISYTWDFGDGSISTQANPSHVYNTPGTYDVTLVVVDSNGCSGTLFQSDLVSVGQPVNTNFSWTSVAGCQNPLEIAFTSNVNPSGSYTYQWDFGDGGTSTQQNPVHFYTNSGNYTVTLIATNANGCSDTLVRQDLIPFQFPTASFNLADTTACVGEMLAIANTSMGASSYLWDFGDGTTQSGQTPIHMYTTPGVYTLQLIASNALGCQDTFTFPQSILVQPSPVAAFTADDVDGCQTPHVVNFTAQTTNTVNWFWDFGDGNTANVANPTHVYNTTGFFDVQLIAESTNGCRDTINQPNFIQIIPPIASFLPDTVEGCTPLGVNFLDLSISSYDSITNWVWDFGDGTGTFAQNPSHTYTGQGLYTVSLTVVTSEGCRDTVSYSFIEAGLLPTVNFTANPLIVCAQDPVSFVDQSSAATEWEWFFGDGTGSILQNPVHAYGDTGTFDVMLVTTNFGCADTLLKPDFIKVLGPIADFVMNPEGGCQVPLTISFTDASIMATGWQWDFGDGSPQDTTQFPTHTYTTPGTYTVQLVVTNDTTTCVDSYSETFEIRTPVAGFTVNQTAGCTGLPVDFTNTSIDGTGYLWDFGDGNFSNQANPSHVYATPGSYDVTLIAQRNGGCADTLTLPNLIQIVGPKAVFLVDTVTGCAPLSVSFMDSSYVVPGTNNITGWFWDFGDGGVGTGPNPTHTYTQTGSYDVQLVIVDDQGCSDTLVKQSLIQPTFPNAAFTTNDTISCPGAPVSFINQSTGVGNTYLWNFGDGNTSTIPNPVHIYPPNIGTYSVVLTVTDANGCVSQTIASNFVEVGPPVANFFASPTQQSCPPLAVSFINQSSSNVTSWNWDFGDGSTSTLANPSKVYSLPGSFDVRLIVSTNQGCTDTLFAADLIDLTGPTGSFTMSNIAGCKPLTVDFAATTNGAVSWTWDFGDGSLGLGQNVSHTYFTDTTAFPVLLIEDSAGCTVAIPASDSVVVEPGPTANFISSESFTCTGKIVSFASTSTSNVPIVSYFWEFGDGDTSALANPTHIYATPGNYSVQLTVTNFDGCSDSLSVPVNITVNTPPQATFTPSQTQGCAPLTVNFGNSSTANGAIVGNFWDFGDGGNAVLSSPSYTFFTPGTYQVKLFVTDNNGCQDSTTEIITVLGSPLPNFIVSSDQGCAPKTVQFTDASVSNAGIQSWFWDFGDGNTGTGNQPQHTYVTNGSFDVSLTVTDANGCVATQVLPDLIELDAPDVSLTSDAVPSCPPLTVNFTGAAQSDTTIVQWEWLFGDGSSATTQNASYIYTQSGNFDVTLIVVDAKGCTDTLTEPQLVTIFDRPVADFAVSDSGICVPATISLTDTSTSAGVPIVSYTYDVSGGGQFNIPNPSIAFNTAGAYTIQQIIEDVNG
ncbi:MAG: PKD domain-containing protein, partial [Bacteroidota bacterium]